MKPLTELMGARESADDGLRKWFSSTDMDLIVWIDEKESLAGFELYYDKIVSEHVLIWRKNRGFAHLAVDDGEQKPVLEYKEAPLLVPDGQMDPDRIRKLFESSSEQVPAALTARISRELARL